MSKRVQGTAVPCTTIANLTERSETAGAQRLRGERCDRQPSGLSVKDGRKLSSLTRNGAENLLQGFSATIERTDVRAPRSGEGIRPFAAAAPLLP